MPRNTNSLQKQLHKLRQHIIPTTDRVKNNSLSRLILACASSIFLKSPASPITRAASRTSRHVSSNRVITRTIVPSATSVSFVISSKLVPFAHSHTTSQRPKLSPPALPLPLPLEKL